MVDNVVLGSVGSSYKGIDGLVWTVEGPALAPGYLNIRSGERRSCVSHSLLVSSNRQPTTEERG